ncbi:MULTISPECIES: DUF624 domain-containing protein [unclassified Sutcliffiella]|uniref:YesL family protein n=1 Tax=unclassified Sutcliffiella TaxID=2837532 RepID=UPI0030D0C919
MHNMNTKLYSIFEWITRVAYLNVIWILLSLSGGIVLGLFPATVSMFAIIRKWLRGDTNFSLFRTFSHHYKREFWKSNRLGFIIGGLCVIFILDYWYLFYYSPEVMWGQILLFALSLLFLLFLFYLFPTYVHYDLKIIALLKQTFLLMLIHPLHTFFIIVCLASLFFIFYLLPATAFIFGGSGYAFITMWLCMNAFQKLHNTKTPS